MFISQVLKVLQFSIILSLVVHELKELINVNIGGFFHGYRKFHVHCLKKISWSQTLMSKTFKKLLTFWHCLSLSGNICHFLALSAIFWQHLSFSSIVYHFFILFVTFWHYLSFFGFVTFWLWISLSGNVCHFLTFSGSVNRTLDEASARNKENF